MQPDPPTLSPQQERVLDMFGDGYNRGEIAAVLKVSKSAVTLYATNACGKLGARSIPQGVRMLDRMRAKAGMVQQTPVSEQRLHI